MDKNKKPEPDGKNLEVSQMTNKSSTIKRSFLGFGKKTPKDDSF